MSTESSENLSAVSRSSFPWLLYGAALAPLLIILFSYLHSDESMREVPVLLTVTIMGGIAGRQVSAIIRRGKTRSWKYPLLLLLGMLLYGTAVFIGFVMVRLGPF